MWNKLLPFWGSSREAGEGVPGEASEGTPSVDTRAASRPGPPRFAIHPQRGWNVATSPKPRFALGEEL
jgi:hypothetical protein